MCRTSTVKTHTISVLLCPPLHPAIRNERAVPAACIERAAVLCTPRDVIESLEREVHDPTVVIALPGLLLGEIDRSLQGVGLKPDLARGHRIGGAAGMD